MNLNSDTSKNVSNADAFSILCAKDFSSPGGRYAENRHSCEIFSLCRSGKPVTSFAEKRRRFFIPTHIAPYISYHKIKKCPEGTAKNFGSSQEISKNGAQNAKKGLAAIIAHQSLVLLRCINNQDTCHYVTKKDFYVRSAVSTQEMSKKTPPLQPALFIFKRMLSEIIAINSPLVGLPLLVSIV